ncbi:Hsp33 family molecular chaperone HslO [Wenzhouxiangella sp. XN24]|uniref:Hsp33 family molecular chaperone HslO n=1 Tax=Wenzhouxiangella sp. XN24 TaxID=2713569 RepID=UPI0013EB5EFD|nr:Hsp33 family molecular chaperone HslO [Wenzhouxiangella sp. XN24]NGX15780.1 Hsp33 family molecular chaperone HslO [Wenzhouxiangella sp. XN24]
MDDGDALRRFMFEDAPVRGEIVRLEESWRALLTRQDYPPAVRAVLGEAMAASALLASTLKFDGLLTLQIQGEGALNLLVAQCASDLTVRGLAKWRGDDPRGTLAELTGGGRLAITIERRKRRERYQGIVLADTGTLAACIEAYFAQSEQLPTRLWLAADGDVAAGMLLQQMPGDGADDGDHAAEPQGPDAAGPEAWRRAALLADTLSPEELLSVGSTELLRRLFHEEKVRLADPRPVRFRCSCTRERVESALRLLGRAELADLLSAEGQIEVRCEFCNKAYALDAVDMEQLLAVDVASPPGSDRLH